ncbi:hypothetical protein FQN57_001034 [Myotisia sp. PD_48]|nr:hypothetical protein FQN57_001034 [Myotisia sp. PD_48]
MLNLSYSPIASISPIASFPRLRLAAIALITVPSLLSDIWESILRAVPKKKTSHMKKRHRQLAGKALKDTISVTSCPACGQQKRAHLLCPTCVAEVQQRWRSEKPEAPMAHP